ncbi:Oar protein [Xanthomonas translucens pv. arrhenatheri]|uniref:TonB-dependent outer membrane receptor oar-like protein n=1 Tax=Xanthomonas graminis pv. arrhenatheri LMG 727 TaxID=1195923 RepID=A0A0K3A9V3_9XANT|nr:TonB-dependent receptor [Xanthomonas translucens]OAX66093.1 Oar protein [Xanthomonas translucens pv. arrhenatheri]UKE78654.1 TonB-dependent receptor [Xanthomonas translucens pv. arrhenatheri]CTP92280.1 TonB-dependent outer membrane receptor oar-like protein [Xanthomonas translucens pv. arrhenatheri LMG 727]
MNKPPLLRRPALLALALSAALAAPPALAQSTTGAVAGQAPANAQRVQVRSDSGLSREVAVDARGRYSIGQLPLGTYTIVAKGADDAVLGRREGVGLTVGAVTDVSFAAVTRLTGVTVSADRAAAAIDVSSVDSRTVINAEQLQRLPLGHSAEAIAQLAPGVAGNSGSGTYIGPTGAQLLSFGGSSAAENAYYINGFNTTDPLRGLGGLTLPYGSIDQLQVYTGGYSAKYGRSDGGVINAVGKRGSNAWHFGGQATWEPDGLRSSQKDVYAPGNGALYRPDSKNSATLSTQSLYAGGPLIQDKLFFFGAYELQRQDGDRFYGARETTPGEYYYDYRYRRPSWYAKLDWNISDNQLLEITGASSRYITRGKYYAYSGDDIGALRGNADTTKTGGDLWTAKYTGYLTDRLTFSAQYGKQRSDDYTGNPNYNHALTYLGGTSFQNPAYTGGIPITNAQTTSLLVDPDRGNRTDNLRLDLNYVIGEHSITVGIDNQNARALNRGSVASGDGYQWIYGQSKPDVPINTGLGVPATGGYAHGEDGYYVRRYVYSALASVRAVQRAQYIEDNWQVSDRFLLSLGLRLDQFTNYNRDGDAYIKQSSGQWAPRLGFSWDVDGDARFKVYGNAGRYYLALPLNPAFNAAGATLATSTYYTYGGIDGNGSPTDLTQISGAVSANNYSGILPDARTVATQGIKPSFQDEFILGFSKAWGDSWVYGAKGTYRVLRSGVDDYCDSGTVFAAAAAHGQTVTLDSNPVSCWLINPGKTNTFTLVDTSGNYVSVPLSNAQFGFPELKRNYYGLNLSLEHPFDQRWYGRLDYTWSRSYGTTEGQLLSGIGQTAVSTTQAWDYAQLMEHTNGPQSNDHTHQFKFYGYYQITPDWLVSANLKLVSGTPFSALGSYGADQSDPSGYGIAYHYDQGQAAPPGSQGRLPWLKQLDLGVSWRPAYAEHRLAFNLDVFNAFNGQATLWKYPYSETDPGVSDPVYGAALLRQAPRALRLSVSYDY